MKPVIHVNINVKTLLPEDLSFLSLQGSHPELYFAGDVIDELSKDKLGNLIKDVTEAKFSPTIHAPFYDLNAGAQDPRIRAITLERFLWAIDTAARLKAAQIVIHPGYGPWILTKRFDIWLGRAKENLNKIVAKASELGIRIAFENIYDTHPRDLAALIEQFPKETVGVCFDIGHFNLFSETSMKTWLDTLGPRIFEVHLHDNSGDDDDHIALGDGIIKFGPLLDWFSKPGNRPYLTLEMEQRTHVIKSIHRVNDWMAGIKD
ncbi:MAG: sugar phosphate isomerase/epimerase [Candidatus Riflebacteria bacterium]|nr:sugar phosphate isomerase/epimerase [Candidatus Riflebacteria bacterium]